MKRYPFTFIELLIVMGILAIVSVVVGVNIQKMIHQQRFLTGSQLILEKLQLAQDLMLILDTDVKVHLKHLTDQKALYCDIQVDKPLSSKAAKLVKLKSTISGIQSFDFINAQGEKQHNALTLSFMSKGSKMDKGVLILSSISKDLNLPLSKRIILNGFPKPIVFSGDDHPLFLEDKDWETESLQLYPQDVQYKQKKDDLHDSKKTTHTTA